MIAQGQPWDMREKAALVLKATIRAKVFQLDSLQKQALEYMHLLGLKIQRLFFKIIQAID